MDLIIGGIVLMIILFGILIHVLYLEEKLRKFERNEPKQPCAEVKK